MNLSCFGIRPLKISEIWDNGHQLFEYAKTKILIEESKFRNIVYFKGLLGSNIICWSFLKNTCNGEEERERPFLWDLDVDTSPFF